MSAKGGWIGVDLDGTLAMYDGWKGIEHIGDPIPVMLARVKAWIESGLDVRVFTARCAGCEPGVVRAIEDWCETHIGRRLPVTCQKDFGMIELWDDRAVQVIPNTGQRAALSQSETDTPADESLGTRSALASEAVARLRGVALAGSKSNRKDYGSFISTLDAGELLSELELVEAARTVLRHAAPDTPPDSEAAPGLLAQFERYLDAYREAIIADEQAGSRADTDPDVDRAWERVNVLGTPLRAALSPSSTDTERLDAQDAARWRKLVALARENHMHKGLGGGVYVCSAPSNDHDAPWASVQAIDHKNPRNTLWLSEGTTLDEAIDAASLLSEGAKNED